MEDIRGFVTCAHCSGTGTCKNGENESSCYACKKASKYNRIVPVLALLIVYCALAIVFLKSSKENFTEILAFAGTLIGSVTGYYFGGKTKLER